MEELETLLNSLIQRGWKPWGEKSKKIIIRASRIFVYNSEWYINPEGKHIRSIVSLESGLWQFVCDRSLLKSIWKARAKEPSISALGFKSEVLALSFEPEYRLLESALIPENELVQFLIDNIKVTWIMN